MEYLLLLYRDENWRESLSEAEHAEIDREYAELHRELKDEGILLGAAPLKHTRTATTVRVRDEETVMTDGPFAETKEQLGGFFLLDVGSMEEARAWAARVPAARHGAIEIRPVVPVPAGVTSG